MPISLTTALDAGDMSANVYDHVKIMRQVHDARRGMVMLDLEYGTVDGSDWVAGSAMPQHADYPTSVTITGAEYDTLVTHASNDGELTYAAVKRGLYEYLQANYAELAGSIV